MIELRNNYRDRAFENDNFEILTAINPALATATTANRTTCNNKI